MRYLRAASASLADRGPLSGNSRSAQAALIVGDSAIEALRDALPVLRLAQLRSVPGIGDKRNLRENGWHVRADQYDEWRLLDSAVLQAFVTFLQPGVERSLHIRGELAALGDLILERDLLNQVAQLMDGLIADRVLTCRHIKRRRVGGEVQVVGLHAARARVRRGVGMD